MAGTTQALYLKSVTHLAESMVIKFAYAARAMNRYLQDNGVQVDEADPRTWRYFRHLSGQYHSYDTVMRVTSQDDKTEIDFTYDNLAFHRATWTAYQVGTDYYYQLVEKYPDQETLIRGILNPVNIDDAIAADDFTILWYDGAYVQPNEENLISSLQFAIEAYVARWYNPNFHTGHTLYGASFYGQLIAHVILSVLTIRKKNTHTPYVHDYHLWAFLGSHQHLDDYSDALTRSQALWLYRNIRYFEHRPGWSSTFDKLIPGLLTARSIPLTSFSLQHNTSDIPTEIAPYGEVIKTPLNDLALSSTVQKTTIADVLTKEINIAKDNIDYYDAQLGDVPKQFSLSKYSSVETKVLESDMIDRSDATPVRLLDTIFNEWVWLSAKDIYIANVSIVNPATLETLSLTAKEALIVWIYCLHRQYDIDVDTVPTVRAFNVMRLVSPTFMELRNITTTQYVGENQILAALEEFTGAGQMISTDKFYETVVSIHGNVKAHRFLYAHQENFHTRGQLEVMTKRFYFDERVRLIDEGTKYSQLFQAKGWQLDNMQQSQYEEFGNELFEIATGMNLKKTLTVRDIQAAMIRLLQQLSSYSIQFLTHITDGASTTVDFPYIRVGDIETATTLEARIKVANHILKTDASSREKVYVPIDLGVRITDDDITIRSEMKAFINTTLEWLPQSKIVTNVRAKMFTLRIKESIKPDISNNIVQPQLDGLWMYDVKGAPPPPVSITEGIDKVQLEGLNLYKYPPKPVVTEEVDNNELPGLDVVTPRNRIFETAFAEETLDGFMYPRDFSTIPDPLDGFALPDDRVTFSSLFNSTPLDGYSPPNSQS